MGFNVISNKVLPVLLHNCLFLFTANIFLWEWEKIVTKSDWHKSSVSISKIIDNEII